MIPGPVVADANILIAFLDPSGVHHEAVRQTLDRITPVVDLDIETKFQRTVIAYMHPLNMAEVLRGYDVESRERVLELVESPQVGIVVEPVSDRRQGVLALARYAERVKMPDACVLALAAAKGVPLLTLDKRLSNAARDMNLPVATIIEPE